MFSKYKASKHTSDFAGIKNGIFYDRSRTLLTFGWMLRHVRKSFVLMFCQPFEVLRFAFRHPKKFFCISYPKFILPKKRHIITPGHEREDMLALTRCLDVKFFEVTNVGRIGHMAGEVDLWLKERSLQNKSGKKVLIMDKECAANRHFFLYCKEKFDAVIDPKSWTLLLQAIPEIEHLRETKYNYFHAFNDSAECCDIYSMWGDRPPLFKLNLDDQNYLKGILLGWGVSEDGWFACFHNRERGYSPADDDDHDYRNADIQDYYPAMQEVVRQGGWVIRIGDSSMTPLPLMDKVIDYAHSSLRSARLDVLLCASARCVVGCSSGLSILAVAFGVPVGMVNLAPISTLALTKRDIGIPKLYFSEKENRNLSFGEAFSHPMSNFRYSNLYKENYIRLVNNDSEDILELTREVLERVTDKHIYNNEDELLQKIYRRLFKPNHYSYKSGARIGRDFLRKYRVLLE